MKKSIKKSRGRPARIIGGINADWQSVAVALLFSQPITNTYINKKFKKQ